MPRTCTICKHPKVTQINSEIAQGDTLRGIASRYGPSNTSVMRHAEKCLGSTLATRVEQNRERQAIDVHKEFEENLAFAKRLRIAAEEYLADPVDSLKLAIIPHADEIDVTYYDQFDLTDGDFPKPKKKTAKLSQLLTKAGEVEAVWRETNDANAAVQTITLLETEKVNIKHVDLRSFALDAIRAVDTCIDKFAKLAKLYDEKKGPQVSNFVTVVLPRVESDYQVQEPTRLPLLANPIEVSAREV